MWFIPTKARYSIWVHFDKHVTKISFFGQHTGTKEKKENTGGQTSARRKYSVLEEKKRQRKCKHVIKK
jgi:hypothetical protein